MGSVKVLGVDGMRYTLRRPGYDYGTPAAYFVTICTRRRHNLLGTWRRHRLELTEAGFMVWEEWTRTPCHHPDVALDAFVIMPDHLHGIVHLLSQAPTMSRRRTLGEGVGSFKSRTSVRYYRGVREFGWPEVNRRFWHLNYHERIIRDLRHLDAARLYIAKNPFRPPKPRWRIPAR